MRYVVVGLGNIGRKRVAALGARCVATVDPQNPEAQFRSEKELAPGAYDAAVLSVPGAAKEALLVHFLSLGKHVLVEKPLVTSRWDELGALARRGRCIWYTSYNHRFEPQVQAARRHILEGGLGDLYHGRMVYGNGTVASSQGTWRDSGLGALEDLGPHLMDLGGYLLGYQGPYRLWDARSLESSVVDQCVFATADRKVILECGTAHWKNRFCIDLYGKAGSVHVEGLLKWGKSRLAKHERVVTRPSGAPGETVSVLEGEDNSWIRDLEEFEKRVAAQELSLDSDRWIADALHDLARQREVLR